MPANVGSLNILLSASANGLKSAFDMAKKEVSSFGSSFKSALTGLPGLVGALGVGAAVTGLVELTKSSFESISTLHDNAIALGTSTEALSRLQFAAKQAGVDAEKLTGALGKMQNNLADAAAGSGPAADAIAQLGLNANKLVNEAPDKAFKDIGDALKGVQNPAERTSLAMAIFGKSGRELLPTLLEGTASLDAMGTQADKLGLSINSIDAETVDRAGDSFAVLLDLLTAVGNQIAITIAPFIDDLSQRLLAAAASGNGFGSQVSAALQQVAGGIAYAADFLSIFKSAWYLVKGTVTVILFGLAKKIELVVNGAISLLNLLPGVAIEKSATLSAFTADLAKQVKEDFSTASAAADVFSKGKNSAAVKEYFETTTAQAKATSKAVVDTNKAIMGSGDAIESAQKAQEAIGKSIDDLKLKVSQFNLTDAEKQLQEFTAKVNAGVPKDANGNADAAAQAKANAQIATYKGLLTQFDAMKDAKELNNDLDKQAAKVIEDVKSPMEKYQDDLNALVKLYDTGRISAEQFAAAQQKLADGVAPKDAATAAKAIEPQSPKLISNNSNEAFKLIAEIQGRTNGVPSKTPEAQLTEAKKQSTLQQKLVDQGAGVPQFGLATINA